MAEMQHSGQEFQRTKRDDNAHPGQHFWRASEPDTLWKAWEKVKANNGAAGGDGVTVARFDMVAKHAITVLSRNLRTRHYRPSEARRVYVPKKSGGHRPLDIPAIIDRVAQGAAALTLMPVLDKLFEPASFAYRPGRGVADAVAKVAAFRRAGFTHVIDADIRRYFENVPHEPLLAKLEAVVGDDDILDLVAHWLDWYAPAGKGLAQGSPLSPLLANLYLDDLDETFEGRGLRIVRYADDFVLLCRSEAIAERTLPQLERFLFGHGLELNVEKTRIVPFEQGFKFLGHLFVRSMVLKEVIDDTPAEDTISAAELLARDLEKSEAERAAPALVEEMGEPLGERARGQHVVHVVQPGRHVTAEHESFAVMAGEQKLLLLPHRRIDRIEIGPGNTIDVAALDLAAATDVEITRINGHGETLGTWSSPEVISGRATRHLAQAAVILDPVRRTALARTLVEGRIRGQRALLHRINRSRKDAVITVACASLRRSLRKLVLVDSVERAMGYEGEAAAQYWPALGRALDVPMGFAGIRRRSPAGSAFDVILNGLASLLLRDIRIALVRAGLHPGFAMLHTTTDGEDALSYDLMEEFRASLVEANAVALVNRKAITPDMFDGLINHPRMSRTGWTALVRGYEAACARTISSPQRNGQSVSWRQLMDDQAQALAAHMEHGTPYLPAVMDY